MIVFDREGKRSSNTKPGKRETRNENSPQKVANPFFAGRVAPSACPSGPMYPAVVLCCLAGCTACETTLVAAHDRGRRTPRIRTSLLFWNRHFYVSCCRRRGFPFFSSSLLLFVVSFCVSERHGEEKFRIVGMTLPDVLSALALLPF